MHDNEVNKLFYLIARNNANLTVSNTISRLVSQVGSPWPDPPTSLDRLLANLWVRSPTTPSE